MLSNSLSICAQEIICNVQKLTKYMIHNLCANILKIVVSVVVRVQAYQIQYSIVLCFKKYYKRAQNMSL